MRPPAPVRSFAPGLSHEGAVGGVLQLQDMADVNQNCILAPALCFEPPPAGLAEGKNGKKWRCNFLHSRSAPSGGGLTTAISGAARSGLPSGLSFQMTMLPADSPQDFRHHGPRADSGSGVQFQLIALFPPACPGPTALLGESGPGQATAPANPRRHRPSQGRGGGGLPARQGRSRFFTQNPPQSRENMGWEAA